MNVSEILGGLFGRTGRRRRIERRSARSERSLLARSRASRDAGQDRASDDEHLDRGQDLGEGVRDLFDAYRAASSAEHERNRRLRSAAEQAMFLRERLEAMVEVCRLDIARLHAQAKSPSAADEDGSLVSTLRGARLRRTQDLRELEQELHLSRRSARVLAARFAESMERLRGLEYERVRNTTAIQRRALLDHVFGEGLGSDSSGMGMGLDADVLAHVRQRADEARLTDDLDAAMASSKAPHFESASAQ